MRTLSRLLFLLPFLVAPPAWAGPAGALGTPETAASDAQPVPPLLLRPVVIGASVSGGFGMSRETARSFELGELLDLALEAPHGDVLSLGDVYLFMDARNRGRAAVAKALEREPSIVFAVDFLFWFGHGALPTTAARLARLEEGLALLETFDCPVVIGDFPDVSPALKGQSPIGPVVHAAQIPTTLARRQLNARLRAWASERPNVVVVPLEEFVGRLHRGEPLEVRGHRFGANGPRALLQRDLLHPNLDGFVSFALMTLDRVADEVEGVEAEHVSWDPRVLRERVMDATREARAEREERLREREERKRRREERRRAKEEAGTGG